MYDLARDLAAVHSKVVDLMLLPLFVGDNVFGPCFVMQYLVS